jgi:MFS transporter, DHA1 family, inner membrane transport protein
LRILNLNTAKHQLKKERIILLLLAGVNFLTIMDFMIMMPLAPQLKRIFEMSPTQWSSIVSSYTFAAAFSGIISIFLIDKFDRKKSLLFLMVGFCIATFLIGMSNSYFWLIISRSVAGLFGGVLGALLLAIVGDIVPNQRRGQAVGIVMAGFSAAAALGVPFGLYFGTKFSWHIPFFAISVMSVLLITGIIIVMPPIRSHLKTSKQNGVFDGIKNLLSDKNQLRGLWFMVLILFGQFSIIPFLSPYMVANVGFSEIQLIYIYLIGGVLTVFSSPLIGKMADKKGKHTVFYWLLICSLIPILGITHLPNVSIGIALIFTSLFFLFAGGRMIPASAIVIATAPPQFRGSYMSIRSSVINFASGLAAFTSGLIVTENSDGTFANYNYVGYLAAITSIASIVVIRKIFAKY